MFTELMPMLRKQGLLITISLVEGETLRATVLPQKASDADEKATTTPLAITGTAEELDRDLPHQLIEFVGAHLQLQSTLSSAKAEMDAAAKVAREEARKKTTKPAAPMKASVPEVPAKAIDELEGHQAGLGAAFYNCLRQALYRWVRVYDDWDARNRIEQMTEWAEGEDDPESYEIPKLEQDLPECLKAQTATDSLPSLASFPTPDEPWLRELVYTTIELDCVSHSIERPQLDEEWLERERSNHALDTPLPSILLYFRPGDAVMACFDDECEYWGQETPEPNLIIPLQPEDPESVRQALEVLRTVMRVLVLTVRIQNLIDEREKQTCDSVSMSEAN